MFRRFRPVLLALLFPTLASAQSTGQVVDQVVAIVNSNVVLKSDVDARVTQVMQQQQGRLPFSERLWYDMLETFVDFYVLIEKGKIDSVVVTDAEVNLALDQRINQMIQQYGSEAAVEQAFGRSLVQVKAEYRDQFREDMLAERVRGTFREKVRITRPEVEIFFNTIPTDSLPTMPETVELAHIVAIPPAKPDAENAVYRTAQAIRDSIVNLGADFETMARRYGEDGTARNGGALPLMSVNDLVPEFSAAASALQPGQVSEVVKTAFGFHIIRLNRRVGDQIETNHILFRVRQTELDDQVAIDRLAAIRDSTLNRGIDFFALARRNSDDKNTSGTGGRLINPQTGDRRLPLEALDPALYRTVLVLEEGGVSEPRAFENAEAGGGRAYRIVKLLKRTPSHRANLEQDYDLLSNYALQQKVAREEEAWMTRLRRDVHIQYLVPSPYAPTDN